ncbi:MerR family transcriptional regulator [Saccharothrix longispora]|uniref:DNA-binding transcriptional MerR regulator n=1 Tax=Saccharothrix longispora TaxID=33920 RepID=A0ABU1PVT5_9PSEU|nr:MerR family transcriptional regulator [Saccharothrix longispora]MDR6594760.1 DNA-binding transcriptional MerR regulator [Saccharothrix longispora]
MDDELWTIEQLPDRVAALLAEDYDGQRNGRVRELPNGRAIRWYTTIGLVDRPAGFRGRTALYGRRHLLQVVAVKKLQAAGRTLAEIQGMTVGASDRDLAELAGVAERVGPAEPAGPPAGGTAPPGRGREGFWRERPARTDPPGGPPAEPPTARPVQALRLGAGVTVVLDAADRAPDATELAAIQAAAAPLLDLLGRTGLAPTTGEDKG